MWRIYTKDQSDPLERNLENFLTNNSLSLSNETDIIELCGKLGFRIIMMPLEKRKLDGVILVENENKIIAVNEKLDLKKARFIIAHELAHYITESNRVSEINSTAKNKIQLFFGAKDKIHHDKNKPITEHDMDYLAAAILVPREQFQTELISNDINLLSLKGASELEIIRNVNKNAIDYFADRYNVETDVIIKRIAEIAYYA